MQVAASVRTAMAESLSAFDEVILTDIYPAREQPIPGVTSQLIYDCLRPGMEKTLCKKEEVLSLLRKTPRQVVVVLGAGDMDLFVPQIMEIMKQ